MKIRAVDERRQAEVERGSDFKMFALSSDYKF